MNLASSRAADANVIAPPQASPRLPLWGYIGAILIAVGWIAGWHPAHPLSSGSFLLLWLGLILTLDGLNYWRRGSSILSAHPLKFIQMFVFSVPFWWLFEALNARVQNWHYLVDHPYGMEWIPLSYNIAATLCFSTVLPAVMEMSALFASFTLFQPRLARDAEPIVPGRWLAYEFGLGVVTLALPMIFPHQAFGLIWVGPLLILDAVNARLRRRSAIAHLRARDWRFLIVIPLATLTCGFFWEMWNFFSLPKWYYTVPYVGFAKVFEMPILGFTGYLPFGLELFALYQFLLWVTRQQDDALPF